ncbi:MAG: MFS transporter [Thermaerobacter sp.]|nr:MFS transporter [Thermaerobacter sp.]
MSVWLDGYNLTVVGAALIWLTPGLHMAQGAATWLAASALLGAMVGGLAAGWLTDRFGRRPIFTYDLIVFVVFALVSAAAPSVWVVMASRLVMGLAIGADYAISPAYLSELADHRRRGYHLGFIWMLWMVGAVGAFALATLAAVALPPGAAWRFLFGVAAIPAVVTLFIRRDLPESPRWLRAQGLEKQGDEVTKNYGLERVADETLTLGRGEVVRRWILVTVPWFLFDFATYGVGLLLPLVLTKAGVHGHVEVFLGSAVVMCGGIVGGVTSMRTVDRWGRKASQTWGLILAGLVLATWLVLPRSAGAMEFFWLLAGANMITQFGGLPTGMFPVEVFPTRSRATAAGVATAVSRLGAVSGVVVLGIMEARFGLDGLVAGAALAAVLGGVVTGVFGFETKNRVLEEING